MALHGAGPFPSRVVVALLLLWTSSAKASALKPSFEERRGLASSLRGPQSAEAGALAELSGESLSALSPPVAFQQVAVNSVSEKAHPSHRHDGNGDSRSEDREKEEAEEEKEEMRQEQEKVREEQEEILDEQEEIQLQQQELQEAQEDLQIRQEELQRHQELVEKQLVEAGLIDGAEGLPAVDSEDSDETEEFVENRAHANPKTGRLKGGEVEDDRTEEPSTQTPQQAEDASELGASAFLERDSPESDSQEAEIARSPSQDAEPTISEEKSLQDLQAANNKGPSSFKRSDVRLHSTSGDSAPKEEPLPSAASDGLSNSLYSCEGKPCGAGQRSCKVLVNGVACSCASGFQLREISSLSKEQLDHWIEERAAALADAVPGDDAATSGNSVLLSRRGDASLLESPSSAGVVGESVCVRVATLTARPPSRPEAKEELKEEAASTGEGWASAGIGVGAGVAFAVAGAIAWRMQKKSAEDFEEEEDEEQPLVRSRGGSAREEIRPLTESDSRSATGSASPAFSSQQEGKAEEALSEEEGLLDVQEWQPTPLPAARDSHFAVSIEEQKAQQQKLHEQQRQQREEMQRKTPLKTRMTMLEQAMQREAPLA